MKKRLLVTAVGCALSFSAPVLLAQNLSGQYPDPNPEEALLQNQAQNQKSGIESLKQRLFFKKSHKEKQKQKEQKSMTKDDVTHDASHGIVYDVIKEQSVEKNIEDVVVNVDVDVDNALKEVKEVKEVKEKTSSSLRIDDVPAIKMASDVLKTDDSLERNSPKSYIRIPEFSDKSVSALRHHPQKDLSVYRSAQLLMTSGFFVQSLPRDVLQDRMPESFAIILDPSETFISREDVEMFRKNPMFQDVKNNPLPWGRFVVNHVSRRLRNASLPSEKDVLLKISKVTSQSQNNSEPDSGLSKIILRSKDPSPFVTHRMEKFVSSGLPYKEAVKKVKKDLNDVAQKISSLTDSEIMDYITKSFVSSFDAHSLYLSGEETRTFRRTLENAYDGFGFSWEVDEKGAMRIVQVYPGSPSEKSGLKTGDLVISLVHDGKAVLLKGKSREDIYNLLEQYSVVLEFEVSSQTGSPQRIKMTRGRVSTDESIASSQTLPYNGSHYTLIKVPNFYRDSGDSQREGGSVSSDVARILKASHHNGVVLDLRNNSGGIMEEASSLFSLFVNGGTVAQLKGSSPVVKKLTAPESAVVFKGPLVVLINSRSASASEMLASALQDYARAVIVGQTSFGKGSAQTVFDLDALAGTPEIFGQVNVTTMMFYRPSGKSLQKYGVAPDIPLSSRKPLSGEDQYPTALLPPPPLASTSPVVPYGWTTFLNEARKDAPLVFSQESRPTPFEKEKNDPSVQTALWTLERLESYKEHLPEKTLKERAKSLRKNLFKRF